MWTRRELKTRAKAAFGANYWKAVLISFIVALVAGGGFGGSASGAASGAAAANDSKKEESVLPSDITDGDIDADILDSGLPGDLLENEEVKEDLTMGVAIGIALIVTVVIIVVLCIALAFTVFIGNPLEVGGARFFIENLNRKAEVRELAYAFDHGYLNIVKTLFFRDLFTFLWCLLFIIPGIVKSYEYRMIPYILADYPDMERKEVFARSKAMMRGNKWKAFVLDLSFIGWHILSLLTLGILNLFYVHPYIYQTNAALYEALAYGRTSAE